MAFEPSTPGFPKLDLKPKGGLIAGDEFRTAGGSLDGSMLHGAFRDVYGRGNDRATNRYSSAKSKVEKGRGNTWGEHASSDFIRSLADRPALRAQVIGVYQDSLKLTWQVAIGISGLGFILVFLQREVALRTTLETNFGLTQERENRDTEKSARP